MKRNYFILLMFAFATIFSSCEEANPEGVITVIDTEGRLVKNAKVEIYSKPANTILEDSDFTGTDGKTYHKFTFEGTFNVFVERENYFNFDRLVGEGELKLSKDEVIEITIELHLP